jgi:hypothetical protein
MGQYGLRVCSTRFWSDAAEPEGIEGASGGSRVTSEAADAEAATAARRNGGSRTGAGEVLAGGRSPPGLEDARALAGAAISCQARGLGRVGRRVTCFTAGACSTTCSM